ncbi:MAG TPA: class I SAM-dependent methyltransferase [Abditibacteriaceae bacterium]|jgi:cephalosporin hydroxylase
MRLSSLLTSFDNISPSGQRKWRRIRRLIPYRLRWFYEGCPEVRGQLWYAERRLLYRTIRKHRPRVVCESGTWLGGGSTLFIAQALHDNGAGILHSTEVIPEFHDSAQRNYKRYLPHLLPHVKFHLGASSEIYPALLPSLKSIGALLLDGAENAELTWREFSLFEPYLQKGAILMAHDWHSEKTARLRPHLISSSDWEIERVLHPPYSLGLAVCHRTTFPNSEGTEPQRPGTTA